MVYEQWSYRRPILVTEQSGSDLSDYAVRIVLNSSNFDSWDKVNPDGSDIRFTDDQGNPLSYWIEKFDSVNQEAIIWVKIPVLQANQQITIYMYYGNPNAVSEEDPESVFSFFDDFNDLGKWRVVRVGGSGYAKTENGWLKIKSTDWCTTVDTAYNSNAMQVIDAKVKVVDNGDAFMIGFSDGTYNDTGVSLNDYLAMWNGFRSELDNQRIIKHSSGNLIIISSTTEGFLENGLEYVLSFGWNNSLLKQYNDYVLLQSGTDSEFNGFSYIFVKAFGNPGYTTSEYWVDWVRVRPYTDPEPSITIMSEEYVGVTISVYDSLLVQNAYVSIQRVLETSILVADSLLVQNANISLSKLLEPSILVSDLIAVKSADISMSKLLEPSILVSDSLLVKNAEISLVRTLEPSILVSNALLVQNAYISVSRSSEPVILVSDDLLVQNAHIRMIRTLEPSILVSDSLLVRNAYIQMLASSEPFITVRDALLVQNANINLQRLLEPTILLSGLWAVRNATIILQRTKEVVTKPSGVSAEGIILFASALGILYALAKKKEREEYEVSYY